MGEAPKSPAIPWDRDLWQGPPMSLFALVLFHYPGVLERLKKPLGWGSEGVSPSLEIRTNIGLKQKLQTRCSSVVVKIFPPAFL